MSTAPIYITITQDNGDGTERAAQAGVDFFACHGKEKEFLIFHAKMLIDRFLNVQTEEA
jgi:hypothetical protein